MRPVQCWPDILAPASLSIIHRKLSPSQSMAIFAPPWLGPPLFQDPYKQGSSWWHYISMCARAQIHNDVLLDMPELLQWSNSVLEDILSCMISQHVDAKQLSSPTKQSQQWPIRISLTKVTPGWITRQASLEYIRPIRGPESQTSYSRVCITRQAIPEFSGGIP